MSSNSSHIKSIPLAQLYERLALAGFTLSPADQLRAMQLLGGPGKAYLEQPEKLRDLLAPVLVRNEEQQQKFYEIFDQYYQDISRLPIVEESDNYWPGWLRWLLVVPLLAVLFGGYYQMWQDPIVADDISIAIDGPRTGIEGDTIKFYNAKGDPSDSSQLKWVWSFHDLANPKADIVDSVNYHFPLVIPYLNEGSYLREVRLKVYLPEQDSTYETRHPFKIVCVSPPVVGGIKTREQRLDAKKDINFNTIASLPEVDAGGRKRLSDEAANWHFEWDFGDGETQAGSFYAVHQYERNGLYQVRLTVTDTSEQGFCSVEHKLDLKIGQDQAYLPTLTLQKDNGQVLAIWSWGYYLLLGLLGLGLLYYWIRWLVQRPDDEVQKAATQKDKKLYARFSHHDKGPYYIPFRNQNKQIHLGTGQLRLADAMRLRQEGLRKEINVQDTLQATIDRGGFPEVRFRYASQATEYLILVDEQNQASHLGQLFKYLAESLKGQDVNVDIYYYRKHFTRFWNRYYPQGRDLDQLQRSYGHYRLLVLGDLHELINPYAKGQPNLRSDLANVIRQWSQRVVVTPVPPVSWSYREKLIARVLNVFPADEEGLAAVAMHIENEEELLPDGASFDRWKELQIDLHEDPDTEYRKWKRWPAIQDYLGQCHPDLMRWFPALAVFPLPTWAITIAIGQGLGIKITYDKLLQLARIPTLQGERFDEKLRQKLLTVLNDKDEKLAREAVQMELNAVKSIAAHSHALYELETSLAIQTFALEPTTEDSREAIRFLLRENLLSKGQEAELDRVSTNNQPLAQTKNQPLTKMAVKKAPTPPKVSVREWLTEDKDELPSPVTRQDKAKRKRHLRKAILYTLGYLMLLMLGWNLGATDVLYRTVFGMEPEARIVSPEAPVRDYVLVRENEQRDSAIVYNNLGVDVAITATADDTLAIPYFKNALRVANILIHGDEELIEPDITYVLANTNQAKVYYNGAVSYLNAYLDDSLGQAILPAALQLLDSAVVSASLQWDRLHARGVVHYYMGSSEDTTFRDLLLLDSVGYFDRVGYAPNLSTLSGRSRTEVNNISIEKFAGRALNVTVDYFINNTVDQAVEIVVEAIGNGRQPASQELELSSNLSTANFRFEPPRSDKSSSLSEFKVQVRRVSDGHILDTKIQAYPHQWISNRGTISTTSPPSGDVQPEVDREDVNIINKAFNIRGEVQDAVTRKPIVGATVLLKEQANRAARRLVDLSTTTDSYGGFSFNDAFSHLGVASVQVIISKEGYQDVTQVYRKSQILAFNPKEIIFVDLKKEIAYPTMRRIGAASFTRGSDEGSYSEDSQPAHEVSLSAYEIGTYEITFAQYDEFCVATQREKPNDNYSGRGTRPVLNVSWHDAAAYCNWLSEQAGYTPYYELRPTKGQEQEVSYNRSSKGYRLPTEAEWEYAAQGGNLGDQYEIYAGSDKLEEVGWYDGNSNNQTYPVGQLSPNNAGLYDMSGNLWEWCSDIYADYPSESQRNPLGATSGSHRVIRGGAWIQQAEDCRIKVRQYRQPSEQEVIIGFRIARSL